MGYTNGERCGSYIVDRPDELGNLQHLLDLTIPSAVRGVYFRLFLPKNVLRPHLGNLPAYCESGKLGYPLVVK